MKQWGSEYQTFEYQKHLKFRFQMVWHSNGRCMGYVLCNRPTIQIPDMCKRKQDGVHLSCIQMVGLSSIQIAFENQTIWHPNSFGPIKYQTSLVFDHHRTEHFGPLTGFFQSGFHTTIWLPDTNLPLFRWLVFWIYLVKSWQFCDWHSGLILCDQISKILLRFLAHWKLNIRAGFFFRRFLGILASVGVCGVTNDQIRYNTVTARFPNAFGWSMAFCLRSRPFEIRINKLAPKKSLAYVVLFKVAAVLCSDFDSIDVNPVIWVVRYLG